MSSTSPLLRTASEALLLVAAVAILWGATAEAGPTVRRYCGAGLTRRISDLCQNKYNDQPIRVRRGIVENCCKNACSDQTLRSYCKATEEPEQAEESPEPVFPQEQEDMIDELLTADIVSHTEQPPISSTTQRTRSKLEIGRVSKDYYAVPWTFTVKTA